MGDTSRAELRDHVVELRGRNRVANRVHEKERRDSRVEHPGGRSRTQCNRIGRKHADVVGHRGDELVQRARIEIAEPPGELTAELPLRRQLGLEVPDELRESVEAWSAKGAAVLYLVRQREIVGALALEDEVRPEAAEAIAALEGVSEVYSVTGQIDLIALIRVRQQDDVATVVADRLNKVPGIISTETHIAFRTYSQHDLESAFSLGLD